MQHTLRTRTHISLATLALLGACTRTERAPRTEAPSATPQAAAIDAPSVRDRREAQPSMSAQAMPSPASPPVAETKRSGGAMTLVVPKPKKGAHYAATDDALEGFHGGVVAAAPSRSMGAALGKGGGASAERAAPPHTGAVLDKAYEGDDGRGTPGEKYVHTSANRAVDPSKDKLSTFAIDVDTASYALARRKLNGGQLPARDAVRVEEFVNSFDYGDQGPTDGTPMAIHAAVAPSPMNVGHHILRVNLQAKRLHPEERKPVHLVYLVDVSGSMQAPDRIGLAKQSLHTLTNRLGPKDTVALCTYAGNTREVLAPTGMGNKAAIHAAIEQLTAGGSTAMASGIDIAYALASRTHVNGEISHVVVLSDGDANVGRTSHEDILRSIAAHKSKGITLSTVGFGTGNYNDQMMEQLADRGDGNYSYIDSAEQADKVFGHDIDGLLQVIARDTKVQVEFMPEVVQSYRLIGYENRDVADRDFRNDHVDAGEVGAGHAVTALYDLVLKRVDASPATVRFRYAPAAGGKVVEQALMVSTSSIFSRLDDAPASFRFTVAVAGLAENLRGDNGTAWNISAVEGLAKSSVPPGQEAAEFMQLVARAKQLQGGTVTQVVASDAKGGVR